MFKTWLNAVVDSDDIERGYFPLSCSNAGSRMKKERILKDNNGVMELETVGETSLYDYIQSHKDSVDINRMLERYSQGDTTALDRVKASYLDLLGAPQSLAEMYSFVRNTTAYFDNLPLEIRKSYDFNVSNFLADFGSEKFMQTFAPKMSDVEEIKLSPEVKEKVDKDVQIDPQKEVSE